MKGTKKILAVVLIMCLLLGGCGRQTGADLEESPVTTQQESFTGTGGDTAGEVASDGEYVYDYQVSMEPIPKEIADLGGPCQGTIHAFPYQIKMGLTQRMLEEDPELKAEVEKRIPEVEAQLSEEIGGEFRVDGVMLEDEADWKWVCTETGTGYQFVVPYVNHQYWRQCQNWDGSRFKNVLKTELYYMQEDSQIIAPKYSRIIEKIFEGCYCKVLSRCREGTIIEISIIQYTDGKIDRQEEQIKMLQLWERIQMMEDFDFYEIGLFYFPETYAEVVEEQYENGLHYYDYFYTVSSEGLAMLIEKGELIDYMRYSSIENSNNKVNLDALLSSYQNGTYRKNKIWPYWIESR